MSEERSAHPETPWRRYRFHANEDDPRPVKFPPPGPFWVSGYGEDYAVVVAYLPHWADLHDFWPEASDVTVQERAEITFTDRFPSPKWWDGFAVFASLTDTPEAT